MSRWFRHYAGMMRDEKIVRVALRSKQTVERASWVWGAILESAAEIDDHGRYELDTAEAAYFLRADEADICAIVCELEASGRLASGYVAKWSERQFQSDRSADRVRAHRDRQRTTHAHAQDETSRNDDVTLHSCSRNSPETESEEERKSEANASLVAADDEKVQMMVDIYHRYGHSKWQRVLKMTPARRSSAPKRLKDCGGMDGWRDAMIRASNCPFLIGGGRDGWIAGFDFFMQAKSFNRLLEGYYDARKPSGPGYSRALSGADVALAVRNELLDPGSGGRGGRSATAGAIDAKRDGTGLHRFAG